MRQRVLAGLTAVGLVMQISVSAEPGPAPEGEQSSTFRAQTMVTDSRPVHSITVPADVIVNVKLVKPLTTSGSELGETVQAKMQESLYIGPYLVAPEGSILTGKVSALNKKAVHKGPSPYIIVDFYELERPGEQTALPFQASLIAYRTGLSRKDYVWRIPTRQSRLSSNLGSMLEGASYGLMVHPIFGPPVGAGFGLLKSMAINKVAQRGNIKINAKEIVPLSVQSPFSLPVLATPAMSQCKAAGLGCDFSKDGL